MEPRNYPRLLALYWEMATIDLTGPDHTYDFRLNAGNQPRFWRRWAAMDRGYWVLATYDAGWDITTYPGTASLTVADIHDATYAWRAGTAYDFTDTNGLSAALTTEGYTVT